MCGRCRKFQSTPVISDGRIPRQRTGCGPGARFNPRPSFLTGESRGRQLEWVGLPGFNPRPSFLTGESLTAEQRAQITACFNPRPSFLTGESPRIQLLVFTAHIAQLARTPEKNAVGFWAYCT